MSQDEVLRCLVLLGGRGSHNELTDKYNKMHFPPNLGYKQLNVQEVKKTLQCDCSKLLRDKMITREYRRPSKRDPYTTHRRYAFYSITPAGYHHIKLYDICKQLEIKK